MSNEIAVAQQNNVVAGFGNSLAFEFMQRQASMLASSALVPKEFSIVGVKDAAEKAQKIANVVIALEMANRIGASPFSVMQNIYIVHGKPSWSSTFVIASINGCGRFSSMAFEMTGTGDTRTCVAYATDKATGVKLESPPISIEMAKAEGWYGKAGSKWKTMPELMLRYRAATLFGRLYAPEILMGMRAVEELEDIEDVTATTNTPDAKNIMERFTAPAETVAATEEKQEEPKTEPADTTELQQTVFRLLAELAERQGESPDDTIDTLTKGKIGCQQDLMDKPEAYLNDIKLLIETELAKEA